MSTDNNDFLYLFDPGTVLFQEGDEGRELYVVHEGKVEISRNIGGRHHIVAIIKQGSFFGEMSLLLGRPRSATATTITPAKLLVFDQQTFLNMVQSQSEIAIRIMKNLAQRLFRANIQIEMLLLNDKTHRIVKSLHYLAKEEGIKSSNGILVPISLKRLSGFVGFSLGEVASVIDKLAEAYLVLPQKDGFLIAEEGKYLEFLEFLEMKDKN